MLLTPPLRKLALTAHVAVSVGWLGAALAYLVVAVAALASGEAVRMHAAYPILKLIGWWVILPLCVGALVQSLTTPWGLVRHYWVVAKLVLTVAMTAVLLGHLPAVSSAALLATRPVVSPQDFGMLPTQLVVHAAVGSLTLLAVTVISIFKPWGMTPVGKRWRSYAGALTNTRSTGGER